MDNVALVCEQNNSLADNERAVRLTMVHEEWSAIDMKLNCQSEIIIIANRLLGTQ